MVDAVIEPTAADAAAAAAKAVSDKAAADAAAAITPEQKAATDKAAADKAAADAAAGQTPEQKAAADKAAADKKVADDAAAAKAAAAAAAIPDKYDLKLPDKSTVDKAIVERIAAHARARGRSQEDAQADLDFVHQELATLEDASIKATLAAHAPGGAVWEKQVDDWNTAALADPEIGGNKPEQLQASASLAKQVVAKFGDKESIEFLEKNPIGSHPALLRLLYRIGKASSEGSLIVAKSHDGSVREAKDIMYPKEKQTVQGSTD